MLSSERIPLPLGWAGNYELPQMCLSPAVKIGEILGTEKIWVFARPPWNISSHLTILFIPRKYLISHFHKRKSRGFSPLLTVGEDIPTDTRNHRVCRVAIECDKIDLRPPEILVSPAKRCHPAPAIRQFERQDGFESKWERPKETSSVSARHQVSNGSISTRFHHPPNDNQLSLVIT